MLAYIAGASTSLTATVGDTNGNSVTPDILKFPLVVHPTPGDICRWGLPWSMPIGVRAGRHLWEGGPPGFYTFWTFTD